MALITAKGIKKYYGDRLLFSIDELEVDTTDRVGIVGVNGSGKTTLIEVLSGRIKPDEGFIRRSGNFTYIPQLTKVDVTVLPEMASRLKVSGIKPENASGGEEMRLKIAQAFSKKADLLFADEPTSNLDINGINILRTMIKVWKGAMVIVSHDQDLLNEFCTKVIEIDKGKITIFCGNFDAYQKEKENQYAFKKFEFDQYCKEKERIENAIVKAAARALKVKKAPSRMGLSEARLHRREATEVAKKISKQANALKTRLNQLELKECPEDEPQVKMVFADFQKSISKTMIQCSNLNIVYHKRVLLDGSGFIIPSGSRTAIIGPNGCGKTSLLRYIRNYGDGVRVAPGVNISWFEQDFSILNEKKSVLENTLESAKKPEWMTRTVLARLLMNGDDIHKPVNVLSGGERCKVCFAKLLLSGANMIVLDEPTNYLDIFSMDALGRLLSEWPGTLIFVSHDRAFVSKVATRLLIFEDSKISTFEGNYRDYLLSQNNIGEKQEILVLKMRMAELTCKLGMLLNAEMKGKYQEEIDWITEKILMLK